MKIEKTLLDSIKDKLEVPSFLYEDEEMNDARRDMIEMARIKSDFDIEKFTVRKEGNFIAHNFHFMMRQYTLTISEVKKMLIEREEKTRTIKHFEEKKEPIEIVTSEGVPKVIYPDLEVKKLKNAIELLETGLIDKMARINRYEKIRKALIKENGGPITDEQYQAENPEYWKWFLTKAALWQHKERVTGVKEGVWRNIDFLESAVVLNPDFVVPVLNDNGNFPLKDVEIKDNIERITNKGKTPLDYIKKVK